MSHSAPIIVTEIPRSGAPVVAHALRVCGAWVSPNEDWPTKIDQEGNNRRIRDMLVRPLFRGLGCSTIGIGGVPEIDALHKVAAMISHTWRSQVMSIVREQGRDTDDRPWLYRGADALLAWPIWVAAFPDARWVMVKRDPAGIREACDRTGYMKAIRDPGVFTEWTVQFASRLTELTDSGIVVKSVWPGRFTHGEMADLRRLVLDLGLEWKPRELYNELTPLLWSNGVYELKGAA